MAIIILLIFILGIASFAFWVWSLIDVAKRSKQEWAAAQQEQIVWVLIVALLGVVGSIVYVVVARPKFANSPSAAFPNYSDNPYSPPPPNTPPPHQGPIG